MEESTFSPGQNVEFMWYGQTVYGTVMQREATEPALFRPFVPVKMALSGHNINTCISPSRLKVIGEIPQETAKEQAKTVFDVPELKCFLADHWDETANHIKTEYAEAYYQLFRKHVAASHGVTLVEDESIEEASADVQCTSATLPPLRNSGKAVQLSFDFTI